MGRPHQFCARAASRSSRDTRGLEPGAFFIENLKWSPDAKWAGFSFQVVHSSLVAQPAISRSAAPARGRRPPVPLMCHAPQRPDTAMLLASRRLVNSGFVLDSPVSSSRRFAMLTIHALPAGLRRPILVMAFSGWNDAAEAATTAARYLATAFRATKFAEIDPEEFYHFGLSRPYVRFKAGSETEREIIWPSTEFSITQSPELARDLVVGVAAEPHLKWKTYCANAVELARRCEVTLVLTLGALLAEVPHTKPVRLVGSASDPELAARFGLRPSKYEGPTGIIGVLNSLCRDRELPAASLWANVPHYISGIENPKASLALVKRVLSLLGAEADLSDLDEAGKQFDQNLKEIVAQNAKIKNYIAKLEAKDTEEEPGATPGQSDLPPASELVAEIEQFLRQQRPE